MANQYPQPEVYTTTHPFAASGTALGSTDSQTIYTNVAHNEQVLIYGVMVNFYEDAANGNGVGGVITLSGGANEDARFAISITAGANTVPTNSFDAQFIHRKTDKMFTFACPVLVNHRDVLQVTLERTSSTAVSKNMYAKVTLIAEIQKKE
jgi:hypothetical protein|tara:strand:- start:902 stop:1354 length:453 start_codon:yes stop_codon:yes gene_type:complete